MGEFTGMAVDRAVLFAFAPTVDDTMHVHSLDFAEPARLRYMRFRPLSKAIGQIICWCRDRAAKYPRAAPGLVGVLSGCDWGAQLVGSSYDCLLVGFGDGQWFDH
ncbi:MAG: hypothetical protein R2867_08295 [Caldilineaceae bacterium]